MMDRIYHSPKIGYNGGRSYEDIVAILRIRQTDGTPLLNAMLDVQEKYNGPALDYTLPWFENEDSDNNQLLTPLLVAEIIDNQAMLASSVKYSTYSPVVRPGVQVGTGSRAWSRMRVHGIEDVYRKSRWKLALRRLYRQLSAYGSCNAIVFPDDTTEGPRIEIRDALTSYPDLRSAEDFRSPEDVGFITGRSAEWLRRVYPESRQEKGGPVPARSGHDERIWDVVEWIDGEVVVIGIMGPRETRYGTVSAAKTQAPEWMELRRWPNKAGRYPGMCPARVTLDTILSQVMNITGHVDVMAKLQILDVIQSEKAIMPDMFMVGADGRPPRIMSNGGKWVDGRTGHMNIVSNASKIGNLSHQPDPLGRATIDRLERNILKTQGQPPQMSGEPRGPLRTGNAIDAMMDIAIEPRILEMHETMQEWIPDLNAGILATYKGYYGSKTFSLYTGPASDNAEVEFKPKQHCESLETVIQYPIPGASVVQTNVILTQMLGADVSSKRTFRRKHPWIDGDGEEEQKYMDEEKAEQAMMDIIINDIASGAAPKMLLVLVEKYRREGAADIFVAVEKANEELQRLQAQEAPPADQAEGQVLPPEAMPGMDAGPGGAQMQLPPAQEQTQIGPTPDQEGIRELQNAISAGNRGIGTV